MKALVLLLSIFSVCWCKPTTVVNFGPVGDAPGIAPGFAYAFRAPAPIFKASSIYPGSHPGLTGPITNHISAPEEPPMILKTQYHSQDQLGQYAFGYVGDASTAHEVRTLDGAVRGSYTYLDANGELQTANYIADNNGFRVEATNLPLAPAAPAVPKMLLPEPVKPTPEVEAATAAHLKAVAEIKAARSKRSPDSPPAKGYLSPPPPPVSKKETVSSFAKAKSETVAVQPIFKKQYKLPIPLKKVVSKPIPLTISHVPVPLSVSPVAIEPHQSPLPVSNVLPQAVFERADSLALQSSSHTPVPLAAVLGPVPSVSVAPTQVLLSQFHSQDELRGYEYGYEGGPSSKHEALTPDGVTRGSYSYVNANGKLQTVTYLANDVSGFRVMATNLPEAPVEPF